MHDDQHGTAIISGAALINGLDVVGKNIDDVTVVISGAGASAISCAGTISALVSIGTRLMCDSKGLLTKSRAGKGELMNTKWNL